MGAQNKEIKIALDIQAKIDKASGQINTLKKQIDNFELSKGLAGEFAKEFKSIENEIAELQRKTASGEVNLIDAKAAEKEIDKIEKRWNFLLSKIGGEAFLEKGLKADAQALRALETLIQSYGKGIKEAENQEARLNKRLEEAKQQQKDLAEIQKDQKVVKASELEDQKAQLAILEKQEKTAKKARDEAEKALRAKVAESNGKYSMDEISQKGSPLRKTDAYRTFRDAQAQYDSAKAKTKTEKTKVSSMVTKEMQVAEAAAAQQAIDKATEALNNYRQTALATAKEDAFKKAKESLQTIAEFKDIDWGDFGIDLADIKSVEDLEKALESLRDEANKKSKAAVEQVGETAKEASKGFEEMGADVKNATDNLEDLDEQARQVEAFEARIKQFLGMAGAVELLRRALSQAFQTTKELDAAMTEMAVVTDLEVGDYWSQLPEHTKRASGLGVAIKEVYEAETLYYQQGLKTNEVVALSTETLKMARIAGLSAEDATNKMTAALRGFNMELNETNAQNVADVYSELAAITASDVNEISSAMTKTASIASSAGMEFETTAAFLSQIIETTRESAETAGTAMKTVIARFQELKRAPGEIGEVDGEIVDANKIETALRSVGVSLRDANGQFRDLDDVFLELSSKWNSLDKNTQRYIATIAAGSRQQSRFIAMMSDYGRTQELVTAANNSAGASQKQYEKTLESLESKLAKLKNAWDEFSMGILESDLVKFGVDALTMFLEIINKATNAFDGLGGTITKVLTTITLFKIGQKVFDKIKQPMMNFLTSLVSELYEKGVQGGTAYAEGSKAGAKKVANKQKGQTAKEQDEEELSTKEKREKTFKEKTGIANFEQQREINKEQKAEFEKLKKLEEQSSKKAREKEYDQAQKKLREAEKNKKDSPSAEADAAYEAAKSKADAATKSLKEYHDQEQKVQKMSAEGWKNVGQGMQQMGASVAALGVGVSMLGGIFEQLGLTELGEAFQQTGNIIIFVGGAFSLLGSILPVVASIASSAGITMQAAFWPVLLIGLIIASIVATIVGVVAIINSVKAKSAEGRLKAAEEAATAAKEAAEKAENAFNELDNALNDLDEQYDTLDELREGTEEWNNAVQKVNKSVMDLIDKYPELAALVQMDNGVMKLDIESDAVQNVIKKYEAGAITAKAVSYGAQAKTTEAKQLKEFSDLEAINKVSNRRGWEAWGETMKASTNIGAGTGILGGPAGLATGAITGTATGLIVGAITGPIERSKTHTDEKLKEAVEKLAQSVQEGATEANFDDMFEYLSEDLGVASDEAKILAETFAADTQSLLDFAEATDASEKAVEAQYGAMAMQAKQLLNLGQYTADEQDQMSNVVDAQKVKELEDQYAKDLEKEYQNRSNSDEFDDMKQQYAQEIYGANARVDGNKILDEKGEVIREFKNEDAFAEAIAAAEATKLAAEAMKEVPGMLNTSAKYFNEKVTGAGESLEKLFQGKEGGSMTLDDVWQVGEAIRAGALEKAWGALSASEKKIYDNDYSKYVAEITGKLEQASKSFEATNNRLDKFNTEIELSGKLTADAAKKWVANLEVINAGGTSTETEELNTNLSNILKGLTPEQVEQAMSEINSIDKTDKAAWDNLLYRFKELGLMASINEEELQNFIESGKEAANAIDKINFETLANDINNTYKLLDKVKEGGRKYSEEDYKALVAANKHLEGSFKQIGDEFVYIGGTMQDLVKALEKNTIAKLTEANRQLKSRGEMSAIIQENQQNYGSVDSMDTYQLMSYLFEMRQAFSTKGYNIEDFGIQGLSLNTDFSKASAEQLKTWAAALSIEGGKKNVYEQDYAKGVADATMQRFTHNQASYNAQMAANTNDEFAKLHQEALIIQAIQSGGVSNTLIEEYQQAIKDGDEKKIKEIGQKIADETDKIVEASGGRDAYQELIDRVATALEENAQKEIDKLSEIDESISTANQNLINKLQEQIDYQREQDALREEKQSLTDLYSQAAYLSLDTSGANEQDILAKQDEIKEAEKNLEQTLIDQALQNLTDANEKASQQRQEQIEILQKQLDSQLESGVIAEQAASIVAESINQLQTGSTLDTTIMGSLLFGTEAKNLGELAKQDWAADLQKMAVAAQGWYSSQGINVENTTGAQEPNSTYHVKEPSKEELAEQRMAIAAQSAATMLADPNKGGYETLKNDPAFNALYDEYITYARIARGWDSKEAQYDIATFANLISNGTENAHNPVVVESGGNQWNWNAAVGKLLQLVMQQEVKKRLPFLAFKTGGLADSTGPAWLDGTKSHPELVLNARDTQNFIQLKDILSEVMARTSNDKTEKKESGDNYFDIDISVENISDDYDVEQLANKIRSMLYEDATYRNVNALSMTR